MLINMQGILRCGTMLLSRCKRTDRDVGKCGSNRKYTIIPISTANSQNTNKTAHFVPEIIVNVTLEKH